MVPVKVAARQKRGEAQEIRVNAKWLICSEECIPEKAQLSLKMGVATHADRSAEAPLFATAEELVPKPVPATWKTSVDVNSEDFILTVDMGGRESHAEYFAYEYGQIDYSAPQSMRSTANGFRLAVRKSPLKVKLTGFLWGVLVIPGRGAWVLNVPYGRPVKMKN
jgi:thiol:disulfide interchange protein DsbD